MIEKFDLKLAKNAFSIDFLEKLNEIIDAVNENTSHHKKGIECVAELQNTMPDIALKLNMLEVNARSAIKRLNALETNSANYRNEIEVLKERLETLEDRFDHFSDNCQEVSVNEDYKINELIDAVNAISENVKQVEKNRSEQIGRISDYQLKLDCRVREIEEKLESEKVEDESESIKAGVIGSTVTLTFPEPYILNCPFCQSSLWRFQEIDFKIEIHYKVRCLSCSAEGSEKPTKQKAIHAWNTRV